MQYWWKRNFDVLLASRAGTKPCDVSNNNEVLSSKIANLRIDYFGNGTVGEAQDGGWGHRLIRKVWPW